MNCQPDRVPLVGTSMARPPQERPARRRTRTAPTLEAVARDLAAAVARPKTRAGAGRAAGVKPPATAGKLRAIPDLKRQDTERLLRLALVKVCGGDATAARRGILWRDADDELVLYVGRARLATANRLVVVSIPVYTDQSGDAEVVVPVVTNTPADPVGLIAATEARPRGPAAAIDVFGEALVATVWAALVETAAAWASAAGRGTTGGTLAPAGLAATKAALRVSAQVPFDAETR